MTVTTPKEIKARKEHRCYWCGEMILIGNQYIRWCCFDSGIVCDVKVHQECKCAWDKGLEQDYWWYAEAVHPYNHGRGCLCENSNCQCKKDVVATLK